MEEKKAPEGREQITMRFPISLLEKLKNEAYERGQSFNEYIIHLTFVARGII